MSAPLHAQTHTVQSREFRCKHLRLLQGWRFMAPIATHYDAERQDCHKTVRCTRCYWPQYITAVYLPTCDRHSLIAVCALCLMFRWVTEYDIYSSQLRQKLGTWKQKEARTQNLHTNIKLRKMPNQPNNLNYINIDEKVKGNVLYRMD